VAYSTVDFVHAMMASATLSCQPDTRLLLSASRCQATWSRAHQAHGRQQREIASSLVHTSPNNMSQ
jgi:hypothetical protein